eukprot:749211-Hanusia_phi.AAC.2
MRRVDLGKPTRKQPSSFQQDSFEKILLLIPAMQTRQHGISMFFITCMSSLNSPSSLPASSPPRQRAITERSWQERAQITHPKLVRDAPTGAGSYSSPPQNIKMEQ